jgi:sterol desaturase/sphingolipid hydroxylase (fatty acid hydroxylase superfamily)
MGILSKFWDKVTGTEKVKVRSRNKKGHYVADDKSTPNVNEAYTTKRVKKKTKINIDNTG